MDKREISERTNINDGNTYIVYKCMITKASSKIMDWHPMTDDEVI